MNSQLGRKVANEKERTILIERVDSLSASNATLQNQSTGLGTQVAGLEAELKALEAELAASQAQNAELRETAPTDDSLWQPKPHGLTAGSPSSGVDLSATTSLDPRDVRKDRGLTP